IEHRMSPQAESIPSAAWRWRRQALLANVRACDPDVDRVERLARGHEQPVASGAAEGDVRADLGQPNRPDRRAVRRDDLHAGGRPRPDVAVDVAADAVGRRRPAAGLLETDELPPVAEP